MAILNLHTSTVNAFSTKRIWETPSFSTGSYELPTIKTYQVITLLFDGAISSPVRLLHLPPALSLY